MRDRQGEGMSESNWFRRMTKYWTPGWLIVGGILLVIDLYLIGTSFSWAFILGLWAGLWAAYPIVRQEYDRGRMVGRREANGANSEEEG